MGEIVRFRCLSRRYNVVICVGSAPNTLQQRTFDKSMARGDPDGPGRAQKAWFVLPTLSTTSKARTVLVHAYLTRQYACTCASAALVLRVVLLSGESGL